MLCAKLCAVKPPVASGRTPQRPLALSHVCDDCTKLSAVTIAFAERPKFIQARALSCISSSRPAGAISPIKGTRSKYQAGPIGSLAVAIPALDTPSFGIPATSQA